MATPLLRLEDWWAVWIGGLLLALVVAGLVTGAPAPAAWETSPWDAVPAGSAVDLVLLLVGLGALTTAACRATGQDAARHAAGFPIVFLLALVGRIVASQTAIKAAGLSYVLWALIVGLVLANVMTPPAWLRAAARTELFIKTGLVLLGAEILFSKMLALGAPGLGVAWLVTPVVFVCMYLFGVRVLGMRSKPLTATISAATSVCGVSAAIAVGAATRARREEIGYAISLTLLFTVAMMVLMPALAGLLGLGQAVAGAWIGGTVDSTGAVVASGALVGPEAMEVAAVVKMIQNVLIGVLAFVVAVVWVTRVERKPGAPLPSLGETWHRFPKFVLGFVGASLVYSLVLTPALGAEAVDGLVRVSKGFRAWLFALAFVSIGLESNFRELARVSRDRAPIVLYVVGQTLNVVLTLAAAMWFFGA